MRTQGLANAFLFSLMSLFCCLWKMVPHFLFHWFQSQSVALHTIHWG